MDTFFKFLIVVLHVSENHITKADGLYYLIVGYTVF